MSVLSLFIEPPRTCTLMNYNNKNANCHIGSNFIKNTHKFLKKV